MEKREPVEISINAPSLATNTSLDVNIGDTVTFQDKNKFLAKSDNGKVLNCDDCDIKNYEYMICNKIPCMSRNFHLEKITT